MSNLQTNISTALRRIDHASFNLEPYRYELRSGNVYGAPNCPNGNKYQWIGYDLKLKDYVRLTKSVFKKLVAKK